MGLGGYLAWTATAREIVQQGIAKKVLPCEIYDQQRLKVIENEIWKNNPYITTNYGDLKQGLAIPLQLNDPDANYCKLDTHFKAHHRFDKHIIEQYCETYGLKNVELKCELYFSAAERQKISHLRAELKDRFVTIEPDSKMNYTPNRAYPFNKWQKIVDVIAKKIQVVQLGRQGSLALDNVVDFTGATTFREAALLIGESNIFLSAEGGLVHAATATSTPSAVVITGYQHEKMVAYPQNININIATHGPCGLKTKCLQCEKDADLHDWREIVRVVKERL